MKLFENYNSARQKYGTELVETLTQSGLPPQFLLSACRFITENGVPQQRIVNLFKEWMRYVVKFNNTDVNKLSYEQFFNLISQEKSKHCVPNVLFSNEVASLGKLNNAKDVQYVPVRNQWCIKSQKWFDNYKSQGYDFYVIYLPQEPLPFTFVVVAIVNGNVEYYDSNDYEQFEDLRTNGNIENSDHQIYQNKLPKEITSYLYNIAANQTEELENNQQNIICNRNMNKNRIRLTESQLHRVIKESVKKVLRESDENPHYFGVVFEVDGSEFENESFDNLRDACLWCKSQVEGEDAPYYGYAAEVFYMNEWGDQEETGYYYGNMQ